MSISGAGPGRGGHLPSHAGHDSQVEHSWREKQVSEPNNNVLYLLTICEFAQVHSLLLRGLRLWDSDLDASVWLPLSVISLSLSLSLSLRPITGQYVGWESVFYVFGSLGVLWFLAWSLLVFDGPDKHPRISHDEKEYLQVVK